VCDVIFKLWFPFSFLAIPSIWEQSSLPASQTPVRMRRNSFTPRASADTVKRPRHYSVGSKPLDLLGPCPSLEARDGANWPQLQVGVQVVPSLCSPSPPSPAAVGGPLWNTDPSQGLEHRLCSCMKKNPKPKSRPIKLKLWCQRL